MEIRVLKALHGDAIAIRIFDNGIAKNILIDGGPQMAFEFDLMPCDLQIYLNEIREKNEHINLLILTHVDDDHIGGLLAAFNKKGYLEQLTEEVWFNSGKIIFDYFSEKIDDSNYVMLKQSKSSNTSTGQGVRLEETLSDLDIHYKNIITSGQVIERFGAKFKILSPNEKKLKKLLTKWKKENPSSLTSSSSKDYSKSLQELIKDDVFKEDKSIHNGSSIAFILEKDSKSAVFLGDSFPSVVVEGLNKFGYTESNPLKAEYFKISHHGSKKNTNYKLLEHINCNKYIISTNGSMHGLPNKVTIARILNHNKNAAFYFNYKTLITEIFQDANSEEFNIKILNEQLDIL